MTTQTQYSQTEVMVVPTYLSVGGENSGKIPLDVCSPLSYMDCGIRLPLHDRSIFSLHFSFIFPVKARLIDTV